MLENWQKLADQARDMKSGKPRQQTVINSHNPYNFKEIDRTHVGVCEVDHAGT